MYAEAAAWYRKAALQGISDAQNNLGVMYAKGQGVEQNYISAAMWFEMAVSNGFEIAADEREIVAEKMTSADIEEAKRRARICLESDYKQCD